KQIFLVEMNGDYVDDHCYQWSMSQCQCLLCAQTRRNETPVSHISAQLRTAKFRVRSVFLLPSVHKNTTTTITVAAATTTSNLANLKI
ncbi:hypothetical protein BLOT_003543, partial [Blomia tropicalis]